MGRGVSNSRAQILLKFINTINGFHGNSCFSIGIECGIQNLGIILENKVPPNLNLAKNANHNKFSSS